MIAKKMNFTDKVVVFVGGLGGIGFETSKEIVKKNLSFFFILDAIENESAIETLRSMNQTCKVRHIKFDITNKASIESAISKIVTEAKYIDILINGAGVIKETHMELTMNVNLIGLINTTYAALPYMDKSKFGRGGLIANIASVAGLEPVGTIIAYSTSKFGVMGFTRCLADSYYYSTTDVAVTAICPGLTQSPLLNDVISNNTFNSDHPLTKNISLMKSQSTSVCAEHIMRVLEAKKNGSFWKSDLGELSEIEFKIHWTPCFN